MHGSMRAGVLAGTLPLRHTGVAGLAASDGDVLVHRMPVRRNGVAVRKLRPEDVRCTWRGGTSRSGSSTASFELGSRLLQRFSDPSFPLWKVRATGRPARGRFLEKEQRSRRR